MRRIVIVMTWEKKYKKPCKKIQNKNKTFESSIVLRHNCNISVAWLEKHWVDGEHCYLCLNDV